MIRTLWTFAALLACFASAHAQLPRTIEPLEEGYELELKSISFASGSINVTPCETCARVSHRTTEQTVFSVNGTPTPYEDFLKVVEERRGVSKLTYVGVSYDIESKLVNRIELKTF